MKILALECSAGPASAAIIEDGKIIASDFVNIKITHSQTLMPMVVDILKSSLTAIDDIGGIAVTAGPGSFTGIRIGISAAKGIAAKNALPCCAVSTLRAMAEMFRDTDCYVCAVMDARCNQVYNALFEISGNSVIRLCEDRALMCDELAEELKALNDNSNKKIIVCGDGTDIFLKYTVDIKNVCAASPMLKFQNAIGVALCTEEDFKAGNTVTADKLLPVYLRLPQAERELKAKKETETLK